MDHASPALRAALERGEPAHFFGELTLEDSTEAARLAQRLGRPRLAVLWAKSEPLTQAAALLRLGEPERALVVLQPLPDTARPSALRARARWQLADSQAEATTQHALTLARQEGDVGAVIAAATLRGEQLLPQPHAALRALAEGLKVTEATGVPSDAHLLAVLAHAQLRLGGAKGLRMAEKALDHSSPRSPARVLALLALERTAEAMREAADGELATVWWREFGSGEPRAMPEQSAGRETGQ
ncbi:hypothetical protein [Deinococcus humi]|uniref:Uncharacterized protein n=1 Tax=Deinococcus humi TaxID=662880 RepID=A0A7W8JTU3_9DEIO|nr:hypothetical protein [Deinococcus humi]MBB5362678.1 hypothetical protein [Deinococcus humi]GGO31148.1 hypothetical protein GCM10008949_26690 [Deinococcus humi]